MQKIIEISSNLTEQIIDITEKVSQVVKKVKLILVYVKYILRMPLLPLLLMKTGTPTLA
ncbi:MAG: hypothetical protein KAT77_02005 [Nanoarchaeota archaeon]|nr:hypothetical protein [Nanoarchaeota archaeon]